jgi:hypothetical protein
LQAHAEALHACEAAAEAAAVALLPNTAALHPNAEVFEAHVEALSANRDVFDPKDAALDAQRAVGSRLLPNVAAFELYDPMLLANSASAEAAKARLQAWVDALDAQRT